MVRTPFFLKKKKDNKIKWGKKKTRDKKECNAYSGNGVVMTAETIATPGAVAGGGIPPGVANNPGGAANPGGAMVGSWAIRFDAGTLSVSSSAGLLVAAGGASPARRAAAFYTHRRWTYPGHSQHKEECQQPIRRADGRKEKRKKLIEKGRRKVGQEVHLQRRC